MQIAKASKLSHVRNLVGSRGTEAVKTQVQDRLKALSFAHQYSVTANLTEYDESDVQRIGLLFLFKFRGEIWESF